MVSEGEASPEGVVMKLLPGSKRVQVDHSKAHHTIDLSIQDPPMEAHIERGLFYVLIDSRKLASDFMKKDEAMTRSLQYAQDICSDGFRDLMEGWIEGTLDCSKDGKVPEKGPKDWSPLSGSAQFPQRGEVLEHENTYNLEGSGYWQGSVYEYMTFKLWNGKEAMAVFWHKGGDPRGNYDPPEVWIGDVERFLDAQRIDFGDMNELDSMDEEFDGGLVWAVEELHLLQADESDTPSELRRLIVNRPKLLSDRARKDIERHPKKYAAWVVDAVESIR